MKTSHLKAAVVCAILLFCSGIASAQKAKPGGQVNFVTENSGTITLRSTGIGANQQKAINDAEINAINALLFRGFPDSTQKTALIGSNEVEEKRNHAAYFDSFYKERYKSFIMSSVPVSNYAKQNSGKKGLSIDIKVNLTALKRDLEDSNVIRKFGF